MRICVTMSLLLSGCLAQEGFSLPLADAGFDVRGESGQTYQFDASDSQAQTWSWSLLSAPPGSALTDADLLDADTPWPSLVPDAEGLYTLELSACDAQGACATDFAQALVGQHARPSLNSSSRTVVLTPKRDPNNQVPEAYGEARRALGRSAHILLNGSASQDPDGDTLSYRWSFTSRPASSTLGNGDIASRTDPLASFTPDAPGEYTLRLWVSDGAAQDPYTLPPVTVTDSALDDWEPIPD